MSLTSHLHYHWPPRRATSSIEDGEVMDSEPSPLDNLQKDVEPSLPNLNGVGNGKGKGKAVEDEELGGGNPNAWLEDPGKVCYNGDGVDEGLGMGC